MYGEIDSEICEFISGKGIKGHSSPFKLFTIIFER